MATEKKTVKQSQVSNKKPKSKSSSEASSDSSATLVEDLLMRTKERWLKDSSLAILCCTENRTGTGT